MYVSYSERKIAVYNFIIKVILVTTDILNPLSM